MSVTLESLIQAAQTPGANGAVLSVDERKAKIKEALAEVERGDLDKLLDEALDSFNTLRDSNPSTDDDVFGLELLADALETLGDTRNDLDAADAAKAQKLAELADRAAAVAGQSEPAPEGEQTPEGDPAVADGDPAVVESDPAPEGGDGGDGGAPNAAADAEPAAEMVTAGGAPRRFSTRSVRKPQKPVKVEPEAQESALKILTASGVRGHEGGQELAGITELAAAASAKIKGLPTKGVRATTKADIATLHVQFPDELVASGKNDDMSAMRAAVDVKRLPGGKLTPMSLTAAGAPGGWCSPSQVLYDIPNSLTDTTTGILDLPEVQMSRGGLRFRRQIDFGEIYATGMGARVYTEAMAESEDEEDYTKQFYDLTCPDFVEIRADAVYTGATAGILQNHAYPEEVEAQISELIAAHIHRINAITIARTEAYFNAHNKVDFTGTFGPSVSGASLNAIEWLVTNERYRFRASEQMRFKVVLPIWYKAVFRADYALRTGVANAFEVSDEEIAAHFNKRGVTIEWVYDWQDALIGDPLKPGGAVNPGTGVGQNATPNAYPTNVRALVYPEGTIVRGRDEIINLEAVYDSVGLKTNQFLRLFMEESLAVAWRAYRGSVAVLPVLVNGATGAARNLDGNGKIIVPTP
ncbi:major capsid hexamer protein [Gordonia Phage Phauci]|uniref:Major capsid hexamer protein n=1 Tax=Gordonia Phage Phauci TaxID=2951392 RepID=A0A9E7NIW0_9CAUD|nr:major capsid hexamer protein [Gordonia Phage Phauci]